MEGLNKPEPLVIKGNLHNNWKRFREDFEVYLIAGDKEKAKENVKIAVFKNLIGRDAADILDTLDIKSEDKELTLQHYIDAVNKYCEPKINILYERYNFYNRSQKPYESFDDFYQELNKMAEPCGFEKDREAMLRDRLVFGIRDTNLKEKFIKDGNPKMQDVVDRCRLEERTQKQAGEVLKQAEVAEIGKNKFKGRDNQFTFQNRQNMVKQNSENNNFNNRKYTNYNNYKTNDNNYKQNSFAQTRTGHNVNCRKCGGKHDRENCPAYNTVCTKCHAKHHYARCCRTKNLHELDCGNENHFIDLVELQISTISGKRGWHETFILCNIEVNFKIDTGSEVNVLPVHILNQINQKYAIQKTEIILRAFGGSKIVPHGLVSLTLQHKNLKLIENFIVVNSDVTPILGLSTLRKFKLIHNVDEIYSDKEQFIKNNKTIFEGLGRFPQKLKIVVKENSIPVTRSPRRIPIAIREKVKQALDSLENSDIIEPLTEPTEWVSNLVIVQKPNGSLRICLDPKFLNEAIKKEYYEIPKLEDLTSKLSGAEIFTVLDLKDGFYQIELDDDSKKLCAFSSPFGCYNFKRLPFGINIAPETFQKLNEQNFGDIPGTYIYIDDLLVTGRTNEEHDSNLMKVVERAKKLNIKFNLSKVQFRARQVSFLGHVFNKEGIQCDPGRIKAIVQMENPKSKKELQRFLGMINYLRSFVPNMAEKTEPLRQMLKKTSNFVGSNSIQHVSIHLNKL